MKIPVVADGRSRLLRATENERERRYNELLLQFDAFHREALQATGVFRRLALRRKIRAEVAAIVRREFRIPGGDAQFFINRSRGSWKAPEATAGI